MKLEKSIFTNPIIIIALILSILGIIFINSTEFSRGYKHLFYFKQIISVSIGIIVYFIVSRIDYHIYKNFSIFIYLGGLFLLLVVLIFGITINGAKSWVNLGFYNGQLAEFSKIAYIIAFASFIDHYQDNIYNNSFFLLSGAFLAPFLLLLILQPDFGTGVVFVCIFLVMFFSGGGNPNIFLYFVPVFLISVAVPFIGFLTTEFISESSFWHIFGLSMTQIIIIATISGIIFMGCFFLYYIFNRKGLLIVTMITSIICLGFIGGAVFKGFLKPYHYERMLVTINPNLDPERKGYNLNQSLISIGGGKIFGHGLREGPQNKGNFLPSSHTDFILSVVAEEWGFAGICFVILLNVLLVYYLLKIASNTRDFLGFLIIIGITSLFMAHFLINVLSIIGLLPIIGIPIPFLSYGGSFILTAFASLGIVYNINSARYQFQNKI